MKQIDACRSNSIINFHNLLYWELPCWKAAVAAGPRGRERERRETTIKEAIKANDKKETERVSRREKQ